MSHQPRLSQLPARHRLHARRHHDILRALSLLTQRATHRLANQLRLGVSSWSHASPTTRTAGHQTHNISIPEELSLTSSETNSSRGTHCYSGTHRTYDTRHTDWLPSSRYLSYLHSHKILRLMLRSLTRYRLCCKLRHLYMVTGGNPMKFKQQNLHVESGGNQPFRYVESGGNRYFHS